VHDAAGALRHLAGSAAREREQQQALRVAPRRIRSATRAASVIVLPLPAPAITSKARPSPSAPWQTASRCASLSFSNGSATGGDRVADIDRLYIHTDR